MAGSTFLFQTYMIAPASGAMFVRLINHSVESDRSKINSLCKFVRLLSIHFKEIGYTRIKKFTVAIFDVALIKKLHLNQRMARGTLYVLEIEQRPARPLFGMAPLLSLSNSKISSFHLIYFFSYDS